MHFTQFLIVYLNKIYYNIKNIYSCKYIDYKNILLCILFTVKQYKIIFCKQLYLYKNIRIYKILYPRAQFSIQKTFVSVHLCSPLRNLLITTGVSKSFIIIVTYKYIILNTGTKSFPYIFCITYIKYYVFQKKKKIRIYETNKLETKLYVIQNTQKSLFLLYLFISFDFIISYILDLI